MKGERGERRGRELPERQDFSNEYLGRRVRLVLASGERVEGVLAASSKYWFKLLASEGAVYVNKAWVVKVEPSVAR